jgi:CO/xanthine dehydrogenase Mo-binding subunit
MMMRSKDADGNHGTQYLGKSVPRVDALEKVTGGALYPGDLTRPGMLHLKTLFAGRPHAKIERLDTAKALAVPGVLAVLTAKDVPVNEYGFVTADQPVLCGDFVRFEGDQVAAVVAETEDAAALGRDQIEVQYEDLPALLDPREAVKPGAAPIHPAKDTNVLEYMPIRKGDVKRGFAQADVIVSSSYFLPMQEHAFLQPEAGLAYMDGEQVVIETAGQWAHHDQRQIAHALGLPLDRVRVIYRTIGGAFGGREDISVQIVLALAAYKTGRPVKTVWTREESIRGHCKRHQMFINSKWGATQEGMITAAEVEVVADAGAYAYTTTMVYRQTALTCTGVYEIPNVKVDAYAVHTNNIPGGAMRGFGSPQGIFAAELQIEKLAEALDLDPVEIREKNLIRPGGTLSVGTALPDGIELAPVLEACAKAAGWERSDGAWRRPRPLAAADNAHRRGIGLAIGFKNVGFSFGFQDESSAVVELHGKASVERAIIRYSGAEMGQGALTVLRQIAAESLGLPVEKMDFIGADTLHAPEASSASASRLTMMGGNAIVGASREAMAAWKDEERPAIGRCTYQAPQTTAFDPQTGTSVPNFSYSPVAQAVEIDVDIESGEISFSRIVTVVDVGKAVNPDLILGQVEGSVVQGIGYSVMEDFKTEKGIALTSLLSTYLIPTAADVPARIDTVILEQPDPVGPWGARGLGEAPLIAIAPAVAAAVKNATGIWFTQLPLVPPTVLKGLKRKNAGRNRQH